MTGRKITILGGGNTAFAVASRMSHLGNTICILEHPEFAHTIAEISMSKSISLEGVLENGAAPIDVVTLDPEEALSYSDLLLLIVPAYAHKPFAEFVAPYLNERHTLVIVPGTLGSLEWVALMAEFGNIGLTVAEVDTAPYVCRKTSDVSAVIWGEVGTLGLGVFPAVETERVSSLIGPLFKNVSSYKDVMACGLSAMNPVVHPAGVLMNAGRVEYSRGEFYFYEEGVSKSVAKVIENIDRERLDIGTALGYSLTPVHTAFHEAGFGPKGDIWSTINGSHMLTRLKAPGTLESRWLTEDIPYGIGAWSKIGAEYSVETPMMDAFVSIGNIVMGLDALEEGRGPIEFGISGLTVGELGEYLRTGFA